MRGEHQSRNRRPHTHTYWQRALSAGNDVCRDHARTRFGLSALFRGFLGDAISLAAAAPFVRSPPPPAPRVPLRVHPRAFVLARD